MCLLEEFCKEGFPMNGEAVRQEDYVAYMLRLWRAGSRHGQPVWRASLEDAHTGERQVFGDIEALVAFLVGKTNSLIDIRNMLETLERPVSQDERTVP
jgi:hypothetical protein